MKQFDITIRNRIGALARLCDALAKSAINIRAIATELKDGTAIVKLVTEDERTTADVLQRARLKFAISEILPVRLIDRPGELAKIAKMLAKARIDIESVYLLDRDQERGEVELALKVSDVAKAATVLK
jgi:hypothetical protein